MNSSMSVTRRCANQQLQCFQGWGGGTAFPDTYWFSPRELKDRGFCVADLRAAVEMFEESMAMAREEAMAELTEEES